MGQRSGRFTRMAAATLLAVGVGAIVAAGGLSALGASALGGAPIDSGLPGHLVLRQSPEPAEWDNLHPGDAVFWLIDADLHDAEESTLALQLASDGALKTVGRMTVAVRSCAVDFVVAGSAEPTCAAGARTELPTGSLAALAPAEGSAAVPLATLRRGSPRHLLVTLGIGAEADSQAIAGASAQIGVGLTATGGVQEQRLARTGVPDGPWYWLLFGAGACLVALGGALRHHARRWSG